jgi:EAL domain-containing protein (putative c-di-GMP-specific phosphodiesterase class I)
MILQKRLDKIGGLFSQPQPKRFHHTALPAHQRGTVGDLGPLRPMRVRAPSVVHAATELIAHFAADLLSGKVYLVYQPIVAVETGAMVGIEGLVRWDDSVSGEHHSPDVILAQAKAVGLLPELARVTIRHGLRDLLALHGAGLSDLTVAVNLSPEQLCDDGLVAYVGTTLLRLGLKPHMLCLEVTEDTIAHDDTLVIAQLQALDALGVILAIDDFGVGFSSLARLRTVPFDIVKIDRVFLDEVPHNLNRAQFLRAIVGFCESIGITPVAEGVETEAQRGFLKEVNCSMMQGFGIALPMQLVTLAEEYAPLMTLVT